MLLLGTITSTGIVPNATNNVDKASRVGASHNDITLTILQFDNENL
mgnify:CR=1 FL=1